MKVVFVRDHGLVTPPPQLYSLLFIISITYRLSFVIRIGLVWGL